MSDQLNMFDKELPAYRDKVTYLSSNWQALIDTVTELNLEQRLDNINEERLTKTIFPAKKDVMNAFLTEPQDVRVVIVGQDPYHDGNANGYAFACKNKMSPSLKQIILSVNALYDGEEQLSKEERDIQLTHWIKQGVLLLNTSLTVEEGKPNSHSHYNWEEFTKEILRNFSRRYPYCVFFLWGSDAKKLKPHISTIGNLILEDVHPMYAEYKNINWNCTHFAEANDFLIKHNRHPILWK